MSSTYEMIEHVSSNVRPAHTNILREIIKEALPANHAAPLSSLIILNARKLRLLRDGSNVALSE